MKNRNLFLAFTAIAAILYCLPQIAVAQDNTKSTTVSVDRYNPTLADALKDALKDATGAIPGVYLVGGVYKIPLAVAVGAAKGKLFKEISAWMGNAEICQHFRLMFQGCRPGQTGTIYVEFKIDNGPPPIVITVPFFAKLEGFDASGRPVGYVAPIGPQGPTMKLRVGGLTLERMDCR